MGLYVVLIFGFLVTSHLVILAQVTTANESVGYLFLVNLVIDESLNQRLSFSVCFLFILVTLGVSYNIPAHLNVMY